MKKLALITVVIALFASCGKKAKESTITEIDKAINNTEKEVTIKKILFVLTSHEDLGDTGNKTGFWVEEFATPYYLLKDKGVHISIATPKGGQPPIDPKSAMEDFQTPSTKRFYADKEVQGLLSKTMTLANVNHTDYDGVFYPGGHGPLWDLAEDKNSIALIEAFYNSNKPVGSVCHGPAIFKNTKNTDGTPLVKGKKVTGFTNTEENAVQLTSIVPFLVEDMLKANGGIYSKGDDFKPYAIEDGSLLTGQNPASSELVAEMLLKKIGH